ncbi:hypothetical protein ACE4RR_07235 [Alteribacillus sp. HJP-4]
MQQLTAAIPIHLFKMLGAEKTNHIEAFFDAYAVYKFSFWLTDSGHFKKVFTGREGDKDSEIHQIQMASTKLINKLDYHLSYCLLKERWFFV